MVLRDRNFIRKIKDTRFLDISTALLFENNILIAIACSDTTMKIWIHDLLTNDVLFIAESRYHNRCVTKVQIIQNLDEQQVFVLSAGTDGKICLWDLSKLLSQPRSSSIINLEEPNFCVVAHHSGINSLHGVLTDNGKILIASGGDDNCVSVNVIEVQKKDCRIRELKNIATYSKAAHSSNVTGMKIIESNKLVSVSIDQRICLWKLSSTEERLTLNLEKTTYVNVADCVDMSILRDGSKLLIGLAGLGLQLFTFPLIHINTAEPHSK
ncbi:WD40-repeat-containing domain protein [Cladochytrium replicatum]|nr:WD40-repeat-containing domain protein [Cladochytrium replicatum]